MKGDHTVKKEIILPFSHCLGSIALSGENRELLEVVAYKLPDSFFGASLKIAAF
jgi:hypothetical protein